MDRKPTVSLCMIVKDEEAQLPRCLASARPFVDEMIVVDTGSGDRTVEIASSLGARVFSFPWSHDFSAARNESLRHAHGDWILYLDADERLQCTGTRGCLREAATNPGVDAFSVPINSRKHRGDESYYHVAYNIRMFRNLPGIHFEGAVHERVEPFLQRMKAHIAQAPFAIEHLGYDIHRAGEVRKLERNLLLLRKHLQRAPRDAYALYYLGLTLIGLQKEDEARGALEQALVGDHLTPHLRAMTLNLLSYCSLDRRHYHEAIELARQSLQVIPTQNTAHLFLGLAFYNLPAYDEALPHLASAYQFLCLPPEQRQTHISQEHSADGAELLKAIATCYARTSQYAAAIPLILSYLQRYGDQVGLLELLGVCYLNTQQYERAIDSLTKAEQLGLTADMLALPLAYAFLQSGNLEQFLRHFRTAACNRPEDVATAVKILKLMVKVCPERLVDVLQDKRAVLSTAPSEDIGDLAVAVTQTADWTTLRALFEIVLEARQDAGFLLRMVAESGLDHGGTHQFCRLLEHLARQFHKFPVVWELMAEACIKTGKFIEAIEAYQALQQKAPPSPEINRRLAGLFVKVGNLEAARRCLGFDGG
jgi:tetratricopeptide (TPR) repeat protein